MIGEKGWGSVPEELGSLSFHLDLNIYMGGRKVLFIINNKIFL